MPEGPSSLGILKAYDNRYAHHLGDHLQVFLDKVAIIAEPSWTPSRLDLVNFRVRTTGVLDQKIVKDDKSR